MDHSKEYKSLKIKITKHVVSLVILIWINLLFSFKYLDRYLDYPLLISIFLGVIYFLLMVLNFRLSVSAVKVLVFFGLITLTAFSIVVFGKIQVETLRVDRWSVIASFWENYFRGDFVYYAKSFDGNPPGAMPFYFILSLPFHMAGETGWMAVAGLFVFGTTVYRINPDLKELLRVMLFLGISVFTIWEIAARSNIFLNASLVLVVIVWLNSVDKQKITTRLLINAFACGLVLSTRFILVIPIITYFIWLLNSGQIKWKTLLVYGIVAFSGFTLTFLPFLLNHYGDFIMVNPFLLQTSLFIPFGYTLGFLLMAMVFGFLCKTGEDTYWFSGLSLFLAILVYFVYHSVQSGVKAAYIGSVADVSYFIFCVPFLLFYFFLQKAKNQCTVSPA